LAREGVTTVVGEGVVVKDMRGGLDDTNIAMEGEKTLKSGIGETCTKTLDVGWKGGGAKKALWFKIGGRHCKKARVNQQGRIEKAHLGGRRVSGKKTGWSPYS